jgi:cyclohexyl-isocyanide hydratase
MQPDLCIVPRLIEVPDMAIPLDIHLKIGSMIFPDMDQCDFTGPFEALARVPNSFRSAMSELKKRRKQRTLAAAKLLP